MIVLGIETTCDETAASVVALQRDGRGHILSNEILSQIDEHAPYGGVVPEIAARAHVTALDGLISRAMARAQVSFKDLDGIAAAAGPGLIGGGDCRADNRKNPVAGHRKAVSGGQSSGGACSVAPVDRWCGFSLFVVAGLWWAFTIIGGARGR